MAVDSQQRLGEAQKQVEIVFENVGSSHPQAADLSFVAHELERLESELADS